MDIFSIFFFRQYTPGKCLLRYSRAKKAFLGYKNKKFKKSKNCIFPKGLTQGIDPKMPIIPTFFFQAIQARKISFTKFQTEKKPFQAIKTRSSNRQKIDIFPNRLTYGFAPKMAIFPTFFLGQIGQENVFYGILEREKRLSRPKKQEVQKVEKLKMVIFRCFCFRQ